MGGCNETLRASHSFAGFSTGYLLVRNLFSNSNAGRKAMWRYTPSAVRSQHCQVSLFSYLAPLERVAARSSFVGFLDAWQPIRLPPFDYQKTGLLFRNFI